ncbi:MAG: hypothetical protein ABR583_07440 [Gaiellaceae bacterium]
MTRASDSGGARSTRGFGFRAVLVVSLAAGTLAGAATAAAPGGVPAATRLASYCSPSGDVCYGVFRVQGAVFLKIDIAAPYFSRYRLCVRDPSGEQACRTFSIRARRGSIGSSVRWHTNFPRRGSGGYAARWFLAGKGHQSLGPRLRFRVR